MNDKKRFLGRVETKQTKFGELIKISFGSADRLLLEQEANQKGWNNLVLKKGKAGNYYLEFDTFQPTANNAAPSRAIEDIPSDDLPF